MLNHVDGLTPVRLNEGLFFGSFVHVLSIKFDCNFTLLNFAIVFICKIKLALRYSYKSFRDMNICQNNSTYQGVANNLIQYPDILDEAVERNISRISLDEIFLTRTSRTTLVHCE